ncbi:receptor expression-enhancing protein 6 isoform X1 [Cervus elaphus]|uniref:receptor expression-enhancing protein 6 isoform X1 n=1 Tax=Cervus elaphus TaxID=9860 RepID=UPI001CC27AF0|nr:receptor expression-enhancing protein 6 isoform X1 [Cervus elaphus]
MRRRRRGRPHLLCPPCPPIGQSGGQEAETSPGAETRSGVERCGSRRRKAARKQSSRCTGRRSSSSCQSRAPKCHGRPAPALRALSGTEELGHRSARGARSQDRCRQAVLGHGNQVLTTEWPHFQDQSYREPKQRGRHCVAHILGGVRPVRASRILQRSTPVLVPFLLRGQVRLPVVLHGSRPLERGSYAVPSHHTSSVSKASRGRGQHRERHQRAGPGRGSRNDEGRESKRDPASEGRVKPPASPNADALDRETEDAPQHRSSADSSADSPAEPTTSPSFPTKPALRSSTSLGQAQAQAAAATTATGTQPPGKHRGGLRSQANSSSQTQAPGQQRARPSTTSSGPSQGPSGSTPRPSTTSSQGPALGQSPSGTTTPTQPPNETPNGPDASAPKSSRRHQKRPTTKATSSTSVPELPASGQPESSPEYSSESTTEVTYSWPDYRHRLRCLQHCWRMKHLAC